VAALLLPWCCNSVANQNNGAARAPVVVDIDSRSEGSALEELPDDGSATVTVDRPAKPEPGSLAQSQPSDRATARALASSGFDKLSSGDAAGALRDFRAADAIVNVPTMRLFVAKAQLQLGRKARARRTLESVVRMPSEPHEPMVFGRAREDAKRLLKTLGP